MNFRPQKNIRTLLFALLFAGIILSQGADGMTFPPLEDHSRYTTDLLTDMKWGPGQSVVESAYTNFNGYTDYQVETRLTGLMKDRLKEGAARFFFKKNKRVRVEVTKGSLNQGAVIVRREDGVVRGCGGGMLKYVKLTLEEDSRMLQLPSGHSIVNADMASLLSEVRSRVRKGAKAKLSSTTVSGKYWKAPVKVIELNEVASETVTDRIYINPKTYVPLEWDFFRDGVLISVTFFDNFQSNVGLEDSLFNL